MRQCVRANTDVSELSKPERRTLRSICTNRSHSPRFVLHRRFRNFVINSYKELKGANPTLPILVRECAGVEPKLWARFGARSSRSKNGRSTASSAWGGICCDHAQSACFAL